MYPYPIWVLVGLAACATDEGSIAHMHRVCYTYTQMDKPIYSYVKGIGYERQDLPGECLRCKRIKKFKYEVDGLFVCITCVEDLT